MCIILVSFFPSYVSLYFYFTKQKSVSLCLFAVDLVYNITLPRINALLVCSKPVEVNGDRMLFSEWTIPSKSNNSKYTCTAVQITLWSEKKDMAGEWESVRNFVTRIQAWIGLKSTAWNTEFSLCIVIQRLCGLEQKCLLAAWDVTQSIVWLFYAGWKANFNASFLSWLLHRLQGRKLLQYQHKAFRSTLSHNYIRSPILFITALCLQ